MVESYVKELIKKHIPENYRVCSGYIATTETINSEDNLLQHDLIIVDNRIPSIYKFGISDIEIVAAESVCGIIEIKRTLNEKIIKEAISHLERTYKILEGYDNGIKSKINKHNLVSPLLGTSTLSPMYAIIGLDYTEISPKKMDSFEKVIDKKIVKFVDLIWGISTNFLYYFGLENSKEEIVVPTFVSRFTGINEKIISTIEPDGKNKEEIYRFAVALLRTWISHCTGTILDEKKTHEYFLSS